MAGILLAIFWLDGRDPSIRNQSGWRLIFWGFALIFFGSLVDITDNFPSLDRFIVLGNTFTQSVIENVFGYLTGLALLAWGFRKWLPSIRQTQTLSRSLQEAKDTLEQQAAERTRKLETEIRERQQVELALRERDVHLHSVIDNAIDAIITINDRGEITAFNPAAETIFGYSSSEVLGQNIAILIPGQDHATHDRYISNYVHTGQAKVIGIGRELDGLRKDGTTVPLDLSMYETHQGNQRFFTSIIRDISERRQAEIALRNSEQHFRALFESAAIGIVRTDTSFRITDANATFLDFVKYPLEELVGKSYKEFTHPDDIDPSRDYLDQVASSSKRLHLEKRYMRKDGKMVWARVSMSAIHGNDEAAIAWMAAIEDITDLKITEQALNQFKSTLDQTHDCVYIFDPDSLKFTYANQGAVEQIGYAIEELKDMAPVDIKPDIDERQFRSIIAPLISGKRSSITFETVHQHKNGKLIPVEIVLQYLAPEKETPRFIAIVRDISERKRSAAAIEASKQMLQLVFDSIPSRVFWKNRDSVYLGCNRQFARDAGLDDVRMIVGKTDLDMPWKAQAERFRASDTQVMESGKPKLAYEKQQTNADKKTIWISANKVPLTDIDGEIIGILGAYEDITERKNALSEREKLQQQLQQAQKMEAIGQLTGGIAHDFNNILASIMGFTQLAISKYTGRVDEKLELYLNETYHAGERARDLIAQLLAFSRTGTGETRLLSLEPLVKETVRMLRSTLPSNIRVQLNADDNVPKITIDPVHVIQIVMNLCINARDAIQGHGLISIHIQQFHSDHETCNACHMEAEGDYVQLCVQDTGAGIEPEQLTRIFDPFFTTKEIGRGTGMGLSVINRIMHENHGHIIVESQPGEGTSFRLLFPAGSQREETAADAVDAQAYKASASTASNILIVDDNQSVGQFIGELLQDRGFRATVMNDSQAAVALFKSDIEKFDLVLTDQSMPELTGAELAQELLSLRPDLPIIIMTGYSDDINEERATRMGIRGYMTKPLESNQLIQMITGLLPES